MKNSEKFKSMQERSDAFRGFCRSRHCRDCELDPTQDNIECAYTWLDLEAEGEKPMPCPFCGTPTKAEFHYWEGENKFSVMCDFCGYSSAYSTDKQEAINAHNKLCRKVKGGES